MEDNAVFANSKDVVVVEPINVIEPYIESTINMIPFLPVVL